MTDEQRSSRSNQDAANSVPHGATIQNFYLQRRQELVSVNRTDLEDIRDFDASERSFLGFGLFLLSGASWLGAEKLLEQLDRGDELSMTPTMWVCVLCMAVGGFLFLQGRKMAEKKTNRIQRIFDETKEIASENKATQPQRGSSGNRSGRIYSEKRD